MVADRNHDPNRHFDGFISGYVHHSPMFRLPSPDSAVINIIIVAVMIIIVVIIIITVIGLVSRG